MAGKASEIKARISLDGEQQFKRAVSESGNALKVLSSESKLVDEQFRGQANTLEALRAKHSVLSRTVEEHGKKEQAIADALKNAQKNYDKVGEGLTELRSRLDAAKSKLEEMKETASSDEIAQQEKEIKELNDAIKLGEQNYQRANRSIQNWQQRLNSAQAEGVRMNRELDQTAQYLSEAEQSADGCASSIDEMGRTVRQSQEQMEDLSESAEETSEQLDEASDSTSTFGDMLKANLTADAIIEGVKKVGEAAKEAAEYVVEVGSSFEAAMSEVQAISGATGGDLESLSEKAKELGASTKFSATEAAEAFKYMSLAGWDTASMLDGIDGIMSLAAASGMDLAQASDMVTDYLSAFGMQASESAKIADMLSFAQANSNTTAEQLGEAYGNCAANMHAAGQDIETTTSILEAFANQGIKGSEAGTKLTAIMRDITAKMKDGKIAIGDTNVQVTDAQGNFRDLTDILADVEAATQGMGDADKAAALSATFTSRSVGGLNMILTEGAGKIANYEDALRNSSGAAQEAADIMQDNLQGDLTTLNSNLEGLGIAAYDYIDGPVRGVVQGVTGIISGITEAITPQRTELEQFIDDIEASNEKVKTTLENAKDAMSGAGADVAELEAYKNTLLDLNSVTEKTEFEKYQVKRIVDDLSGSIPELAAAFDEEAGSIRLTNKEIEYLIGNQEALLMQQAAQEAQSEVYKALFDAELNKAKADSAVAEAQEAYNKANEELNAVIARNAEAVKKGEAEESVKEYSAAVAKAGQTLQEAKKEQEESNAVYEEAQGIYKDTRQALDDVTNKYREVADAAGDSATSTEDLRAEQLAMRKSMEDTADATSDAADAQGEYADEVEDATKTAAEAAKEAADIQKEAMRSVMEAYESAKEEAKSGIKFDFFSEEFDGGADATVEQMIQNAKKQVEGLKNYEKNLALIRDHVGKEIAPEFLQYLESLGTDGANALEHIRLTFEQDNGSELVKQWSDSYVEALELQDRISEVLAGDAVAMQAGLRELGSTDYEFEDLADSIEYAVDSAAENWADLPQKTKVALDKTVEAAREVGITIPEGLADGIASGEVTPEQATDQLNAAIQGRLAGMAEIAQKMGIGIPENIAAGMNGSSEEMATAYQSLIELLKTKTAEIEKGIEEGGSGAGDAASNVVQSGVDSANESASGFSEPGEEAGSQFVSGMSSKTGDAAQAGGALASAAYNAAASWTGSFYSVGVNMAAGVAQGINAGGSGVVNAMTNQIRTALSAAKQAAEIQSPSKKFRKEVGQQIGAGVAFGVKDKTKDVVKAAEDMSAQVFSAATSWLSKYKDAHKVSLADERWYWDQVVKHVKNGVEKYEAAQAKIGADQLKKAQTKINSNFGVSKTTGSGKNEKNKDAETYYSDIYQAASKYLSNQQVLNDWSLQQQLKYWQAVKKHLKSGTQGWYDAQKQINSLKDDIAAENADLNDRIVAAAEDRAEKLKILGKMSTTEEREYWQGILRTVKKGSDAWYDAKEKVKDLKAQEKEEQEKANDAILSNAEKYVEHQKILGKMDTQREREYWEDILKQVKKGSDAWWEAKEKIIDLKEQEAEEREQANDDILSDAEKYVQHQKILDAMSTKQELAYWEGIIATLEAGSDAWYEAYETIKGLREDIAQEAKDAAQEAADAAAESVRRTASVQNSILTKYKTYYDVSAKAEMQYWDIARQQFAEGTDERIEADQAYFDARQEYYDQLAELDEDYAEKKQQIDDDLADSIEELQNKYDDAVKSREQEILSSFNLFEAWDAEGYQPEDLLKNLETQVEGLDFWQRQLDELSEKGLSEDFLKELKDMGPDAAANLWSLNQMTAEQLDKYQDMWKRKNELAHQQAVEDNEDLLEETETAIENARKAAKDELAKLEKDYRDEVAKLNTELSAGLKSLVSQAKEIGEDMVSALIKAVRDGATEVSSLVAKMKKEAEDAAAETQKSMQAAQSNAAAAQAAQQAQAAKPTQAAQPTQAATSTPPAQTQPAKSSGTDSDRILAIITSGETRKKTLTAAEKKQHHDLWKYIVQQYGRTPTMLMYRQIAAELGVKLSSKPTVAEKDKVLSLLKKKGYAAGSPGIKRDDLEWLEEYGQTEYVTRKSDGAILQPMRAGDKIVNPAGSKVLYDFANDPTGTLSKLMSQNPTAFLAAGTAGIARLNRLMERGSQAAPVVNVDNSGLVALMRQMVDGMQDIMTQVQALQDRQIYLDTGVMVGQLQQPLSRKNAAIANRRNKGGLR